MSIVGAQEKETAQRNNIINMDRAALENNPPMPFTRSISHPSSVRTDRNTGSGEEGFLVDAKIIMPPQCAVPFGDSPIGQELAVAHKEKHDYLRNATMTAASAVLLFSQYGVHYYANHEGIRFLPWASAERCILVFLASTFCYRAGMNLVPVEQSTFQLLLPEILTLGALSLGLIHALRLASFLLTVGSMYLMIFALASTVEKFMALNKEVNDGMPQATSSTDCRSCDKTKHLRYRSA